LVKANVPVYQAPEGWRRSPRQWWKLRGLIRELRPDIVHSQVNFSLLQQVLAVRLASHSAFCVTERNCYVFHGLARWRRVIQFHLLRMLRGYYSANGVEVAAHLSKVVKVDIKTIPVLPNGVPMLTKNDRVRAAIRSGLGWSETEVGIGYVARMNVQKGHRLFLQVLGDLRRRGVPVKACLVGDGHLRDDLERCARDLDIADVVEFVGLVNNVDDYMQAFDIVALFSSREGMPNVVLEAMAAGRPIVATSVGSIVDLVQDGVTGLVIDDHSVAALSSAAERLIRDGTLRQQFGQRAAEHIREHYSIDSIYTHLLDYYATVTA
jgi:glycosyltransferase involved in cell wall biosynthesis